MKVSGCNSCPKSDGKEKNPQQMAGLCAGFYERSGGVAMVFLAKT